ncbi:hypothetical protein [Streptomyces sp. NRRL S-813]|uniref:hypothetical protein n=1 Tax=Streptomyces sp. NRRL S-813 TaxID=1463919 RepID=UPI0004C1172A|nr:hypothetical protein [Streptomyces sp. NRRL S-813]
MADSGTRPASNEPRSPWLRPGFVLAAAFLGFVAVIGAVIAVTSRTSGSNGGSTTTETTDARTADPSATMSANDSDACPELADQRQDVPTSAPKGVTWSLYDGVALPSSKESGPAVVGKDLARCYARTPVGALLATSQISVRYLAADDWLKVTRTQTVGKGRDAYIAGRTKAHKTVPPEEGAAHGQIAGFRFVTYNDTTAVIETVWRFPDGRMQAATTTALWHDADWRLEYPAEPADPVPVGSLAGYTEWGGM